MFLSWFINMVKQRYSIRDKFHKIVFESETFSGKLYDFALIFSIILSILVVILDSVLSLHNDYGKLFWKLEWLFTIVFTADYVLRIAILKNPRHYIFSFYGIVDLVSAVPSYLVWVLGDKALLFIIARALRLTRLFRIFKLTQYVFESKNLVIAIKQSKRKIIVFLTFILCVLLVISSLMHVVEKDTPGFENIPQSIYWSVVTMTTTGYGDVVPRTPLGKFFASLLMILAYDVLAVPTGIISAEIAKQSLKQHSRVHTQACRKCGHSSHDYDAIYCKFCGEKI